MGAQYSMAFGYFLCAFHCALGDELGDCIQTLKIQNDARDLSDMCQDFSRIEKYLEKNTLLSRVCIII